MLTVELTEKTYKFSETDLATAFIEKFGLWGKFDTAQACEILADFLEDKVVQNENTTADGYSRL